MTDKKGSYLVEAAMTLPVFILAVVALSLLIQIIAICENIGHLTALEIKAADLQAFHKLQAVSLCNQIEERVREDCEKLTDFQVTNVNYLFKGTHTYDLIGVTTQARFTVQNPIGLHGEIQFKEKLLSRGFTGALQDASPLEEAAFHENGNSTAVVVFPKYGMRYHIPSCTVVASESKRQNQGLEMSGEDAKRKGYTPCLICGGGEG